MNKDINREEVKRVLKSSKVKEAAYQYFINKKELQNHIDDKSMYGHVDGIPDWKDIHAAQDEANENRKRNQINLLPNNPDPDIPNKYINPNEKRKGWIRKPMKKERRRAHFGGSSRNKYRKRISKKYKSHQKKSKKHKYKKRKVTRRIKSKY